MTGERLTGSIDAVEQVEVDLPLNFRDCLLHGFTNESLGRTRHQERIVGIHPLEPMLRAAQHCNGGGSLNQQLAPPPAVVFDALRGLVLFGDVARGTGHRFYSAACIEHRNKDVIVVASLPRRTGERRLIPHRLPRFHYLLNLKLEARGKLRGVTKLKEVLSARFFQ